MDQVKLAEEVADSLEKLTFEPSGREYFSKSEATELVDLAIHSLEQSDNTNQHAFTSQQRKHLIETLVAIPLARGSNETCLIIGDCGLMSFWASKHLGYERVFGLEMSGDCDDAIVAKQVEVGGDVTDYAVYNFDIQATDWPISETFDTLVFWDGHQFGGHLPTNMVISLSKRMTDRSVLVMSVANASSYKTLSDLMEGRPPSADGFSHQDKETEGRRNRGFSPFDLVFRLRSAGFELTSLKTVVAYSNTEKLDDLFEIGNALGIRTSLFGDTIVLEATKADHDPIFKPPNNASESDSHIRAAWPVFAQVLQKAAYSFDTDRVENGLEHDSLVNQQRLEIEHQNKIIWDLRQIIDVYQSRSGRDLWSDPTISLTKLDPQEARVLYGKLDVLRILASSGTRKVAFAPEEYLEKSWFQILLRHPFKVSVWRAARRLQRFKKRNR
ncbi:MAG: hypothetical protein AAGC79_03405 [Pseudomonadota bacterium]